MGAFPSSPRADAGLRGMRGGMRPVLQGRQRIRIPLIAREITRRWISLVPSKIV
jgi:hypothetical protein